MIEMALRYNRFTRNPDKATYSSLSQDKSKTPGERKKKMKLVTFNIRCDCDQGTLNVLENRKPYIRAKINEEQPDLIGFQEVQPHVAAWLSRALPEYTVIGCGRDADRGGEAMTMAFRKEALSLLDFHTFWLSETPEVPASRFPGQSIFPRICSRALFREEASGRVFAFYNTHLDHERREARIAQLRLVLEKIKSESLPVLLTGDFNTTDPQDCVEALQPEWQELLQEVTSDVGITFHGYGQDSMKLDCIFISPDFTCRGVCKWTDVHSGVYLSDHYPVAAWLDWKQD